MRFYLDDTNQKGFTLLETLVAMVILLIGLLALAGLQTTVIQHNVGSKNLTSAVYLAEAKIAQLKNVGYSGVTTGAFSEPNINEQGQSGGIFNRSWTVADYGTNMYQVTVTVAWNHIVGGNRSTFLTTVLSVSKD